jgi:hypothetical protein
MASHQTSPTVQLNFKFPWLVDRYISCSYPSQMKLINPMEKLCVENHNHSTDIEILRLFWKSNVNHHVHKSPSVDTVLSQTSAVRISHSVYLRFNFVLSFHLFRDLSSDYFCVISSTDLSEPCMLFLSPYACFSLLDIKR